MSALESSLSHLTLLPPACIVPGVDFTYARHVAVLPALIQSLSSNIFLRAWETCLPASFIYSRGRNVAFHYGLAAGFNTVNS